MIVYEKHDRFSSLILGASQSFSLAINNESKLTEKMYSQDHLCGFSGVSFRHFMNNMGALGGINYLEVGSYCGSTLFPFLYRNLDTVVSAYAIDNWSEFNEAGDPKSSFFKNLNYFFPEGVAQLKVIEDDCFSVDTSVIKEKIDFYFYDGPHSKEDHYNAFMHYDSVLADCFITVIDDWNSKTVREGTERAFSELNYNVVSTWEVDTTDIPGWSQNPDKNWWRGARISIIQKENTN